MGSLGPGPFWRGGSGDMSAFCQAPALPSERVCGEMAFGEIPHKREVLLVIVKCNSLFAKSEDL